MPNKVKPVYDPYISLPQTLGELERWWHAKTKTVGALPRRSLVRLEPPPPGYDRLAAYCTMKHGKLSHENVQRLISEYVLLRGISNEDDAKRTSIQEAADLFAPSPKVESRLPTPVEIRDQARREQQELQAERRQQQEARTRRNALTRAFEDAASFTMADLREQRGTPVTLDEFCVEWAKRFTALGAQLTKNALADHIKSLPPGEKERAYAIAILQHAVQGRTNDVAELLREAAAINGFDAAVAGWLRSGLRNEILGYRTLARLGPDGIMRPVRQPGEAEEQWQKASAECRIPIIPRSLDDLLARADAQRLILEGAAISKLRGVRVDDSANSARFLRGELGDVYALPTLEPLWNAMHALNLGDVPEWRGEPQTGPEAFEALDTVIAWCRRKIASTSQPDLASAPPCEHATPLSFELFYSYSHKDEKRRSKLETHLSQLKNDGLISAWHDHMIRAGDEWEPEIARHLQTARVILLLVSPDFLASHYCYEVELKRAMERHDAGQARVIPIILRHCDWLSAPFCRLKALPTDGHPVAGRKWKNQDEAFTDIARGIRHELANLR
jgi:hypothetical protein